MGASKQLFDAIRRMLGRGLTQAEVEDINHAAEERAEGRHTLSDPAAFFEGVRKVTGPLDATQVETINRLLAGASHWPIGWLAYGLATAWHEARLKPIPEWGKGRGRPYAKPAARMKAIDNPPTYGGQIPYGRGLVQLTWAENYEWADKALGLNGSLLKNFERALEPDIAARILIKGMEEGAFTKKALSRYLTGWRGTHEAFVEARRIINGTDKRDLIAGYAEKFQDALEQGGWA